MSARGAALGAVVFGVWFAVDAPAAPQPHWKCDARAIGACVKQHGRLSSQNGIAFKIWLIGTTRMVAVENDADDMPPLVQKYLEMTSVDHSYIFGDFDICPVEPDVPGHIRRVCVAGAEKLVVQPLDTSRPPFRLLSTWPTGGAVQSPAPIADGPPTPFEDVGACPFEGCVYRQWTARASVPVRTAKKADAPIAFTVRAGEKITALTGVVITTKAGRVQFSAPRTLTTGSGNLHIEPGQTLYMLTYEGEGYTKAWFNGRLYTSVDTAEFYNGVCDARPERCAGKIVEPSQTEWWVQVRNSAGKTGWTSEAAKFDGKNAIFDRAVPRPAAELRSGTTRQTATATPRETGDASGRR